MNIPFSYWVADSTKPVTDLDLMYLYLSVTFWKINQGSTTTLYTDKECFEFYNNLGLWDEIKIFNFETSIIKEKNKFWAAGKLQAMREFETPFAILDLDMFFTDKIDFDVDVIAAHREDGTGYYFDENNPIIKKAGIVPLRRESYALNVSFLYIKNEEFRKIYVDTAIDWMEKISAIGNAEGGHMTFCEQKLLYDLVINNEISHKTLIPNETNCPTQSWIPHLDENISPFFHLAIRKYWARKSNFSLLTERSKVLRRLKRDHPHLIKPLFEFIKLQNFLPANKLDDKKSDIYTLKGNFDLLLTGACTLSCKGCTYLDYKDIGCTINKSLTFDDINIIINQLISLDLRLDTLTLLGGEPTLHPDYLKITKLLHQYKGKVFNKLRVITNGTFLNDDFIKSLDYIDVVRFSIYPNTKKIEEHLHISGLYEFIKSKCVIVIRNYNTFFKYGEGIENIEYSKQLNWDRCRAKERCRPITRSGIYRCYISYNNNTDLCDFSDRQTLIDYINNDSQPLDLCESCPMPCKEVPWESNNKERDDRMLRNGINFIESWKSHYKNG